MRQTPRELACTPTGTEPPEGDDMTDTSYLVVWWMGLAPHAAIFENRIAAEAAASVRNALMVTVTGRDAHIDSVLDWYRRSDEGEPMPAEWRDLVGHMPSWLAKHDSVRSNAVA